MTAVKSLDSSKISTQTTTEFSSGGEFSIPTVPVSGGNIQTDGLSRSSSGEIDFHVLSSDLPVAERASALPTAEQIKASLSQVPKGMYLPFELPEQDIIDVNIGSRFHDARQTQKATVPEGIYVPPGLLSDSDIWDVREAAAVHNARQGNFHLLVDEPVLH